MSSSNKLSAMEQLQVLTDHDYQYAQKLHTSCQRIKTIMTLLSPTMEYYETVQGLAKLRDYYYDRYLALDEVTPTTDIKQLMLHPDKMTRIAVLSRMSGKSMVTNRVLIGRQKHLERFWDNHGTNIEYMRLMTDVERYDGVDIFVSPAKTLMKLVPGLPLRGGPGYYRGRRNAVMAMPVLRPQYLEMLNRLSMVVNQELLPRRSSNKTPIANGRHQAESAPSHPSP